MRKKIVVCICMTLVIISSTVIMAKLGLSSTYRVSNLAFLAGIYTYNMKMYISLLLAKPDIIFWNSLAFLFFVFLALLNIKGSAYLLIPIWCFCLLLGLSIMMPESKNDVAYFFSKISYEFYICQGITFLLLDRIITCYTLNNVCYLLLAISINCIVASLCRCITVSLLLKR